MAILQFNYTYFFASSSQFFFRRWLAKRIKSMDFWNQLIFRIILF